jgi:hypothetical protein
MIDTTFAVYNKKYFRRDAPFEAVRVAGLFTCRHLPWYRDSRLPLQEEEFYRRTARVSTYLRPSSPPAEHARPRSSDKSRRHKRARDVILYVVGDTDCDGDRALRDFLVVNRRKGESKQAHLERVTQLVDEAIAAGGTHLVVPREHADWLRDHPLVTEYFAKHFEMANASAETGIVFALYP